MIWNSIDAGILKDGALNHHFINTKPCHINPGGLWKATVAKDCWFWGVLHWKLHFITTRTLIFFRKHQGNSEDCSWKSLAWENYKKTTKHRFKITSSEVLKHKKNTWKNTFRCKNGLYKMIWNSIDAGILKDGALNHHFISTRPPQINPCSLLNATVAEDCWFWGELNWKLHFINTRTLNFCRKHQGNWEDCSWKSLAWENWRKANKHEKKTKNLQKYWKIGKTLEKIHSDAKMACIKWSGTALMLEFWRMVLWIIIL